MFVQIDNFTVLNTDRIETVKRLGDNQVRVQMTSEGYEHFNMSLQAFMERIDPPSDAN